MRSISAHTDSRSRVGEGLSLGSGLSRMVGGCFSASQSPLELLHNHSQPERFHAANDTTVPQVWHHEVALWHLRWPNAP